MESNEIRRKFYSPSTKFYGRMYGTTSPNDEIVEIDKRKIKFTLNGDAFYFVWGWPGPDWNLYRFIDYGITWAFDMADFKEEKEEVKPDGIN